MMLPDLDVGSWRSLVKLCGRELVLVFRERRGSGSSSMEGSRRGDSPSSLPRIGSGEACMELLRVMAAGSGDMTGEPCCGLEATDE